jgi:hypothetical protein
VRQRSASAFAGVIPSDYRQSEGSEFSKSAPKIILTVAGNYNIYKNDNANCAIIKMLAFLSYGGICLYVFRVLQMRAKKAIRLPEAVFRVVRQLCEERSLQCKLIQGFSLIAPFRLT